MKGLNIFAVLAAAISAVRLPQRMPGIRARHGRRRMPGLGWSVAHDRRMAKKRRNRARHRQACKGR